MKNEDIIEYLIEHPEDIKEISDFIKSYTEELEQRCILILGEEDEEVFFDVLREDYEKIVGKCFLCQYLGVAIKVLDSPSNRKYYEFLFEQFEKHGDETWHCKDYIWLQDQNGPKYDEYLLTNQTEMNIASESMYQLGKDGNLYTSVDCGNMWYRFVALDQDNFNNIREEAIKNNEV